MDRGTTDIHWLSLSNAQVTWKTLTRNDLRSLHVLSIILEDQSYHAFDAVRVVVVYRQIEAFTIFSVERDKLIIEEYDDPTLLNDKLRGNWVRDMYSHTRDLRLQNRRLRSTPHSCDSSPRICTIALELEAIRPSPYHRISLLRLPKKTAKSRKQPKYTILFDRTYRKHLDGRALFLVLQINPLPFPTEDYPDMDEETKDIPKYACNSLSIRILPVDHHSRHRPRHIPQEVISLIVLHAVNCSPQEATPELLEYALVNKSWRHVLELFWKSLGQSTPEEAPPLCNPYGVAQAIIKRPHLARHMRFFNAFSFYRLQPRNILTGVATAVLRSARALEWMYIPHQVLLSSLPELRKLRVVKTFSLRIMSRDGRHELPKVSTDLQTIQQTICKWKWLKSLELMLWGPMKDTKSTSATSSLGAPTYSLTYLALGPGRLTGPQLLYFVSGPPNRLETLGLIKLDGLTNSDLRNMLAITCVTLKKLHIQSCTVAAPEGKDAYAVDALLPKMTRLQRLTIQGNMVSLSALTGLGSSHPAPNLELIDPLPLFTSKDAFLSALASCSWAWIRLTFKTQKSYNAHAKFVDKCDRVAGMRNTVVDVAISPPPPVEVVTDDEWSTDESE